MGIKPARAGVFQLSLPMRRGRGYSFPSAREDGVTPSALPTRTELLLPRDAPRRPTQQHCDQPSTDSAFKSRPIANPRVGYACCKKTFIKFRGFILVAFQLQNLGLNYS